MNPFANTPHGTTRDVQPYLDLVRAFTSRAMDAHTFEIKFAELWRLQRFFLPEGLYDVMQELFDANEDYVEEDHLRDPGELDAEQFRARVTELEPELIARFEEARLRESADAPGTAPDAQDQRPR